MAIVLSGSGSMMLSARSTHLQTFNSTLPLAQTCLSFMLLIEPAPSSTPVTR